MVIFLNSGAKLLKNKIYKSYLTNDYPCWNYYLILAKIKLTKIMKKIILITFIIFSVTNLFAQKKKGGSSNGASISIGVMGMAKNTWLFNNNVLDAKNSEQEMEASFGSSFGINASVYFTQNVGIGLDVLYATHNQKFNGVTDDVYKTPYKSKFHISSLDIPLYLRLSTNGGAFFELGSYFSVITASKYSSDVTSIYNVPANPFYIPPSYDAKINTTAFNIAPLFGFGIDINLTDFLILTPALRFSYGLTDLQGVDGRGTPIENYSTPEKTHSLSGGLSLGVVYRIDL